MIERELLEEMFENIRQQTDWDLGSDLLWSYFFVADSVELLEQLGTALAERGFMPVELARDDESGEWWLTVERIEMHSIESLQSRNDELEALADKYSSIYDGMDVGEPLPAEEAKLN